MTFLQGVPSLPARLVHHTGTMVRFTTRQLARLPQGDVDCRLRLPDGAIIEGHFRRHPQNPYIGGRALVRWIKSWVPYNAPTDVTVHQVGSGNVIRLEVVGAILPEKDVVVTHARSLAREPRAERRRRLYARWERDPRLRSVAIAAWGPVCQVTGCSSLSEVPAYIQPKMVDVHHLNHVASGGSDSPLNISILCVVHHQLIHRAMTAELTSWDLDGASLSVNGLTLKIVRDARFIL